jgi:hypothetical protein
MYILTMHGFASLENKSGYDIVIMLYFDNEWFHITKIYIIWLSYMSYFNNAWFHILIYNIYLCGIYRY